MMFQPDKLTGGAGVRCSDHDRVAPSYESRERRRLQAEAEAAAARDGATNPRLAIVGD